MMWELYERLIEPIPDDVPVDEIIVGTSCTMVRAGGAAGGGRQPPAAGIQIPPEFFFVHPELLPPCMKLAIIGLALRTADDFADSGE